MSGELRGAAPAAGRRRRRGAAEPNAGLPRPCAGVACGLLAYPRLAQGGGVSASTGAGDAVGGGRARVSGC